MYFFLENWPTETGSDEADENQSDYFVLALFLFPNIFFFAFLFFFYFLAGAQV